MSPKKSLVFLPYRMICYYDDTEEAMLLPRGVLHGLGVARASPFLRSG